LINQWANVIRWEMRTKPFLRTLEFLWQEGHTCHATAEEALEETTKMLGIYAEFLEEVFAIPVVRGVKTESEKFAGAQQTYCLETMMQDKKALQAATSHFFGTKFAEVFDIKFQDKDGQVKHVHQTSWGSTTRLVGALIMTHSDDQGLVLPPKAAPTQVVIIPITQKNKDNSQVMDVSHKLFSEIKKAGIKVQLDDREGQSAGYKFNEWEIQGVPLRIEIGPRDLATGLLTLARRDDGSKTQVKVDEAVALVAPTLDQIQKALFEKAKKFLNDNIHSEDDYAKFQQRLEAEAGFYRLHWCGSATCEEQVKQETMATIRCIPLDQKKESGKCVKCGEPSTGRVIFARNY
jgi:prolyl-tRNA synthetase